MTIFPSTIQSPLVTICIPVYNHEQYISEAIESIFSQKISDIQIILSDDASKDKTVSILKEYKSNYSDNIDLILHEKNVGIAQNIDSIYPHIRGKYVCWFAGDDCFLPQKLSKQIAFMEKHLHVIMSYHDVWVRHRLTGKQYAYNDPLLGMRPYSGNIAKNLISERCFIPPTSVMIRRDFTQNLKHEVTLGNCNDWVYYVELATKGPIGYLDEILSIYYRHQSNATKLYNSIDNIEDGFKYIANKYGYIYQSEIKRGLNKAYFNHFFKSLITFNFIESKKMFSKLTINFIKTPILLFQFTAWFVSSFVKHTLLKLKTGSFQR